MNVLVKNPDYINNALSHLYTGPIVPRYTSQYINEAIKSLSVQILDEMDKGVIQLLLEAAQKDQLTLRNTYLERIESLTKEIDSLRRIIGC